MPKSYLGIYRSLLQLGSITLVSTSPSLVDPLVRSAFCERHSIL